MNTQNNYILQKSRTLGSKELCYILQNLLPLCDCNICFTYVTKTCGHLSTYSRKLGITMTPLFFRLILWKSPPQSIKIFVKLDFFSNFLVVLFIFVSAVTLLSTEWVWHWREVLFWFWQWQKMWILWVGRTFS